MTKTIWAEVFTYIQSPSLKQVLAFGGLVERVYSGFSHMDDLKARRLDWEEETRNGGETR